MISAREAMGLGQELAWLRAVADRPRVEDARLGRLLELTPRRAAPPGAAQAASLRRCPARVDRGPTEEQDVPGAVHRAGGRACSTTPKVSTSDTGRAAFRRSSRVRLSVVS